MRRGFTRRKPVRPQRTRVLIVCGGQATEVNYFRSFPVDTLINKIDIQAYAKDPCKIVQRVSQLCARAENEGKPYNQAWCVFDKDDFTPDNFNTAVRMAAEARIKVAYSNQAFELWYCLHFDFIESAVHRRQYAELLASKLGLYRKNDRTMYDKLLSRQKHALQNAQRLHESKAALPPAKQDPVTLVFKLVEALNNLMS